MENVDEKIYKIAKKEFSKHEYISTGKIQRILQVPYLTSDSLLDILVLEGFASPRIGAYPFFTRYI